MSNEISKLNYKSHFQIISCNYNANISHFLSPSAMRDSKVYLKGNSRVARKYTKICNIENKLCCKINTKANKLSQYCYSWKT